MARRRRNDSMLRELRERKYRLRGSGGSGAKLIPNSDSDFAHMARIFANHIEANAERFGIAHEQVANLGERVAAFRDALHKTITHATCGPSATGIKNTARVNAEAIVRTIANLVRVQPLITDVDRLHLNIHKRPQKLKRRECPDVAPVLMFKGSTDPNGSAYGSAKHILEYANDFDRASNAKPRGVARLELFVDLVPPTEPIPVHPGQRRAGQLWYLRSFTTARFEVEPPVLRDGTPMRVCYWGRWADTKGNTGPFSKTCVARVEGDQLMLPGAQQLPVFDERHRRKNVVGRLPQQFGGFQGAVVVESGARYALPEQIER